MISFILLHYYFFKLFTKHKTFSQKLKCSSSWSGRYGLICMEMSSHFDVVIIAHSCCFSSCTVDLTSLLLESPHFSLVGDEFSTLSLYCYFG